jgi:hypothetical protein
MVNNYSKYTNEELIEQRNTAIHYLNKINRGHYDNRLDVVYLYHAAESHKITIKNITNELNKRDKTDKDLIKELKNKLQELENNITIFKDKLKEAISQ